MKKIFKFVVLGAIALVFIFTLVFLYKKSHQPSVVYKIDTPIMTTIIKKTVAIGKVIPRREVDVKAQVSGVVEKLFIVAGQTVHKGDFIARIALRPTMLSLNQAESQLESAKINLQNQQVALERSKKLFAAKMISQSDLDQVSLSYNLQKEAVESGEDSLLLLKTGSTRNSSMVSNMIPATISGMVLDVPNKEGAFIVESSTFSAGTTLATLADMNDMIFEGLVDESEVGKLKEGMDLVLNVGALEGKSFSATLEYISPNGVTDQGATKFTIRAAVKLQKGLFLRANYSANADIVLAKKENVLAINEGDLDIEGDKTYVDVETGPQQFRKQEVKTGLSDGINIEVVSGLKQDEKIKHRT